MSSSHLIREDAAQVDVGDKRSRSCRIERNTGWTWPEIGIAVAALQWRRIESESHCQRVGEREPVDRFGAGDMEHAVGSAVDEGEQRLGQVVDINRTTNFIGEEPHGVTGDGLKDEPLLRAGRMSENSEVRTISADGNAARTSCSASALARP